MQKTTIEWADMTWNPVSGCSKVSPGCKFCYAETIHNRFHKQLGEFNTITLHPEKLDEPLRYKKPKRIFVNSMSDLFHEDVPFEFIQAVFSVMSDVDQHTYMVLTKRPERMLEFYTWQSRQHGLPWQASDNVWIGVSVENQKQADYRIPELLKVPATVHFLSCEPLLGRIDLHHLHYDDIAEIDCLNGTHGVNRPHGGTNQKIKWVIAGGESGHHARPVHPDWLIDIKNQCATAGVPFFFKQWGEWLPIDHCDDDHYWSSKKSCEVGGGWTVNTMFKVGKKKAGNTLCGQQYLEFPHTKSISK